MARKKRSAQDFLIVCLYVDDLIYVGSNQKIIEEFKRAMMNKYEMTDLGLMKYFLCMQVQQSEGKIFISQEKICKRFIEKIQYV